MQAQYIRDPITKEPLGILLGNNPHWSEWTLECHDWAADRRPDSSDDGSWLSLFGLAADWQENG